MPSLNAELPDDLYWLKDQVEALVRPSAFLKPTPVSKGPAAWVPGSTCLGGLPDVPRDAPWLDAIRQEEPIQSPQDGPAFWMQLNLEEIPAEVRKPQWPAVGIVWVYIDVSGRWKGHAYFDERPAALIPWLADTEAFPCLEGQRPYTRNPVSWVVADTLPFCSEDILPEVFAMDDLAGQLDDWVWRNYESKKPSRVKVGGWVWPVQGDLDEKNPDFVCAMERQEFGDCGAVYLYYNQQKGFWVEMESH